MFIPDILKRIEEIYNVVQNTPQHEPTEPDQLAEATRLEVGMSEVNTLLDLLIKDIKERNE